MPNLSELKLKYPTWDKMRFEPVPLCPKCHGTDEIKSPITYPKVAHI